MIQIAERRKNREYVRLGDVCEIVSGSTPKTGVDEYWNGDIVWITPTDLSRLPNPHVDSSQRAITEAGYASCSTKLVPKGAVVMSTRAPIGHLGIAGVELCTNQGCKTFVPNPNLDSEFLYFALLARMDDIQSLGSGTTFTEVSKTKLSRFEISLPPLAEQRRIVASLNAQMAVVERAKQAAREILDAAESLNAAIIRELMPYLGHEFADFWKWAKLGEVCRVVNGSGFSLKYQGHSSLPIPFIKVSDMNTEGNEKAVSKSANTVDARMLKDLKAKTCPAGSVIFPKVGGALLTNKKRILRYESAFDNNIMGVVPVDVSTEWLFYWLQTIDLPALANVQALPSIRSSVVKEIKIPVPPISEQRRIAALIDNQLAAARKLQSAARDGLDAVEAMPSALLRRALGDGG